MVAAVLAAVEGASAIVVVGLEACDPKAQRLQYPLIKEYTLNYSRIPYMIN